MERVYLYLVSSMSVFAYCDNCRERLYVATGFGLIQCVKGLMSFEDEVSLVCVP